MIEQRWKQVLDFESPELYKKALEDLLKLKSKGDFSTLVKGYDVFHLDIRDNNLLVHNQIILVGKDLNYNFLKNKCYKKAKLVLTDKDSESLNDLIDGSKVIRIEEEFSGNFVNKLRNEIKTYFNQNIKKLGARKTYS